jgi:HEPN domain-containing protein
LRYAKEDLAAAEALHREPVASPRHACWLAQQGAEKALKAALIALQVDYPRSHDLDLLLRMLPAHWNTHQQVSDLSELSEWSIEARYPGEWPEPSIADASAAVAQARAVVDVIITDLEDQGLIPRP